ncbi:MAG TPA: glucosyl-3-phosphoglycerate synthase [Nocardioidaceae bacterium]|nr:glucosyl-3-phosphoglycerate synthase [Nocardioidaceae bacterium]
MEDPRAGVSRWFDRRTYPPDPHPPGELAELKGGQRISVVLPARDEQATIGSIVECIRSELVERSSLVDEITVIDSRSHDRTATIAREAGATVWHVDEILPALGPGEGKGEALWKSLAVTSGDIGVFLDADVDNFGSRFVTGLLSPLLRDASLAFVKGFYERPGRGEDGRPNRSGGGRVTELVARPIIATEVPELAGFIQPLAGECAFRREVLSRVPFVSGYGVEIGLLIDVLRSVGLDAMGQADLGVRTHAHQDLGALTAMATQIRMAVSMRTGDDSAGHGQDAWSARREAVIPRVDHADTGRRRLGSQVVTVGLRPPMHDVLQAWAHAPAAERP